MRRKISLSKQAEDFISVLPAKQYRQVVIKAMSLTNNAHPHDYKALDPKHKRVDVGEYRIIYRFDDDCVYIITIGKRNDDDVYKRLKNLI